MKAKNSIVRKNNCANLRARRVRARISGTLVKPRLSIKRSLKHIYAQLIDDVVGKTLVSVSDSAFDKKMDNLTLAKEVGKLIAAGAKEKGINSVVFDRGSCRYHGRVAALADGAREGGLNF
jgi:large subunit ribosomal protein L18